MKFEPLAVIRTTTQNSYLSASCGGFFSYACRLFVRSLSQSARAAVCIPSPGIPRVVVGGDYWRGRVPDLQLWWMAIRGAINVVNYAPSGLWSVRVRESEKVLLEASDVIGEVQRYWEALYAKRPVNLPAFERLVRAHIPKGVPEEWRSVQDYPLQDLKDAVRQAVADDKAPGSNRVTAALIAELPEPVQGLLVHAYRAILRGADVPESWHEAII